MDISGLKYTRAKQPFNQEESDYAACWEGEILHSRVGMLKVTESKEWDPIEYFHTPSPLALTVPPIPFDGPSQNTRS